jgi:hypothetical protein
MICYYLINHVYVDTCVSITFVFTLRQLFQKISGIAVKLILLSEIVGLDFPSLPRHY